MKSWTFESRLSRALSIHSANYSLQTCVMKVRATVCNVIELLARTSLYSYQLKQRFCVPRRDMKSWTVESGLSRALSMHSANYSLQTCVVKVGATVSNVIELLARTSIYSYQLKQRFCVPRLTLHLSKFIKLNMSCLLLTSER